MEQDKKSGNNGYELRKAAGLYWLLDLRQGGEHYKPPLAMNEMDLRCIRFWALPVSYAYRNSTAAFHCPCHPPQVPHFTAG